MSSDTKAPAPARPSSTVMLLRDGADGLEVFMVKRHHEIDFASGALVFPGGSLDAGDSDARLRAHVADAKALDDQRLAYRIGAIREAFEEAGVLLARPVGEPELVHGARLADLATRYRKPLETGEIAMADLAETEKLEFACELLVPFAHWITPTMVPKRFDTRFYLAPATESHVGSAQHDGTELVDSIWIRPQDALADAEAGRAVMLFPTRLNLIKLGRSRDVATALETARHASIVTVMPEVVMREGKRMLRIPGDADYGVTEVPVPEQRP